MRNLGRRYLSAAAGLLAMFITVGSGAAFAQSRVSDKDLENLIRNLRDDAKSFRPVFEKALKKSSIRKTSEEKDANKLAEQFEKQANALLENFKKTKKGDDRLNTVISTSQQITEICNRLRLNGSVASAWDKIQDELHQVTSAYGMGASLSKPDRRDWEVAQGGQSCSLSVGETRSSRLVEECLAVSPSTHPPCNARNSCVLIIDEIKRGCSLLGRNAPAFCAEYN